MANAVPPARCKAFSKSLLDPFECMSPRSDPMNTAPATAFHWLNRVSPIDVPWKSSPLYERLFIGKDWMLMS